MSTPDFSTALREILAADFDPTDVKIKVNNVKDKNATNTTGMAVCYVEARPVMDRFNVPTNILIFSLRELSSAIEALRAILVPK